MAGVLFGFMLRLALLTVAVVFLRKLDWIDDIPLLFTVLIRNHLLRGVTFGTIKQ